MDPRSHPGGISFNFGGKGVDNSIGVLSFAYFLRCAGGQIIGMKKIISLLLFILAVLGAGKGTATTAAYAQDVVGFSLSLGLEGDGYSSTSMGFGVRLAGDYRFGEHLSIGTSSLVSSDTYLTTLEFSGTIRYYLLRDEDSLIKHYNWASVFHFFLQAEGGAVVFMADSDFLHADMMLGLATGSRIALSRYGSFYIEPYLRIGYPHLFSIGILGVYRFPIKGVFW
jgi:hypothetical protein